MKVLDSHFHLWQLSQVPQPWIDPEAMAAIHRDFVVSDYEKALKAAVGDPTLSNSVEFVGGVLVQTISHDLETDLFLLDASHSSQILGVVGWVDLTRADLGDELQRLKALPGGHKLVGIRHQIQEESGPGSLNDPRFFAGLEQLIEHGLTFDLIVRADQVSAASQLAEQLPELMFVLDHAGKPAIAQRSHDTAAWTQWEHSIADLAHLPNVAVKWSGLSTEADWDTWTEHDLEPVWKHLHATFGPDRIMWGSDWPVVEISGGASRWTKASATFVAGLTESEQQSFWFDTAKSVYGLACAGEEADTNDRDRVEHE